MSGFLDAKWRAAAVTTPARALPAEHSGARGAAPPPTTSAPPAQVIGCQPHHVFHHNAGVDPGGRSWWEPDPTLDGCGVT